MSEESALDATLRAGLPDRLAHGVVEVHRQIKRGVAAKTSDVSRVLLGREPHTFREFAHDVQSAFR